MNSRADEHPRVLVSAYLDEELNPAETALVEAHLRGCDSCRGLLEDYRAVAVSAASEMPPSVAADLRMRIRHRLDEVARPDTRRSWFDPRSHRLGIAAAAGVVLVIGVWIFRHGNTPDRGSGPRATLPTTEGVRPAPAGDGAIDHPIPNVPRNKESRPPAGTTRDQGAPSRVAPAPVAQRPISPSPPSRPEAAGVRPIPLGGVPTLQEGSTGRLLIFEFPDYVISLSEDGTLVLSSGEYQCTVHPEQPSPDPEVNRLFGLASRMSPGASGSGSPGTARSAPTSGAITLEDEKESARGAAAPGRTRGVDATAAIEMEKRLRVLLRDRYIGLLESRCGPVPQAVHSR